MNDRWRSFQHQFYQPITIFNHPIHQVSVSRESFRLDDMYRDLGIPKFRPKTTSAFEALEPVSGQAQI